MQQADLKDLEAPFADRAKRLDERVWAHITWQDWLTALACMGVLDICALTHMLRAHIPFDYFTFISTASGDFSNYHYPD